MLWFVPQTLITNDFIFHQVISRSQESKPTTKPIRFVERLQAANLLGKLVNSMYESDYRIV